MIIIGPRVRFPACRLGIVRYWASAPTAVGLGKYVFHFVPPQEMSEQTKHPLLCCKRELLLLFRNHVASCDTTERTDWYEWRVEEREALRRFFLGWFKAFSRSLFMVGWLRKITMDIVTSVHCASAREDWQEKMEKWEENSPLALPMVDNNNRSFEDNVLREKLYIVIGHVVGGAKPVIGWGESDAHFSMGGIFSHF